MLFYNYGLFWRAEDVFWGRPKNPGKLFGIPANLKSFGKVDFKDQSGIYALYADYQFVYIGQAGNKNQKLLCRLNQHRRDHLANRWNMFSWFGTRSVLDTSKLKAEKGKANTLHSTVLNQIEAVLIHTAEPPLNRQGGKWGEAVEQYIQVRDERLGPSVPEMVEIIWEKHKNS